MRWYLLSLGALIACAPTPPPTQHPTKSGEVPANSLSETRLNGEPKKVVKDEPPPNDPTQPYIESVGSSGTSSSDPKAEKKTGKVTRAECNEAIDHYLSMQMESDPRFAGIPPEIMENAKKQAAQQKGDPCKDNIPRAKYNCAMSSKSTKDWEKCMK